MNVNEAEIQVLAQLFGAQSDAESTDRGSLEERGNKYWIFREDWSPAFSSLVSKKLIEGNDQDYRLTDLGRPLAQIYFEERPDLYWYYYQRFYGAAHGSDAHSRFCERVYGMDLCQEGMTDMAAISGLLDRLELHPGQRLLDLGCGAGGISAYISEQTDAHVTGIDYSALAVSVATERTDSMRSKTTFLEADLNTLDLPRQSFDAAISIDSIYWVSDVPNSIERIVSTLKPGGQFAILVVQLLEYCDSPDEMGIDNTPVAMALKKLGLGYQAINETESFREFWPKVKIAASDLQDDFEREGNGFICEHWMREADAEFLPALKADELRRYFYHVRV